MLALFLITPAASVSLTPNSLTPRSGHVLELWPLWPQWEHPRAISSLLSRASSLTDARKNHHLRFLGSPPGTTTTSDSWGLRQEEQSPPLLGVSAGKNHHLRFLGSPLLLLVFSPSLTSRDRSISHHPTRKKSREEINHNERAIYDPSKKDRFSSTASSSNDLTTSSRPPSSNNNKITPPTDFASLP
jgi:hypothetical protein